MSESDREKVWSLIKNARTAQLVSVREDGSLDARPMGCLQREFDLTLWFLTFRRSPKVGEIARHGQVLVSYADPGKGEYVSVSGRGRIVDDRQKVKELWNEGLRVWFPSGPDDPDIAMVAVEAEAARYWTNAASVVTYAWSYLKSRTTGQPASADDVAEVGSVRF
jgi:general stress protein 26